MAVPKTAALPLGDAPTDGALAASCGTGNVLNNSNDNLQRANDWPMLTAKAVN
jgi:hypothetical protein